MNKKTKLIFILILLAIFISLSWNYGSKKFSKAALESTSSLEQIFSMRDLKNNPIAKPQTEFLIVNFWATWCPPCIEEVPSLIKFAEKYSKYFTLIAMSQDAAKKDIESFMKVFPSLKSNFVTMVHDDNQYIAHLHAVKKLPETFIYDIHSGKYLQISGSTNWEDQRLIQTIEKHFNKKLTTAQ